MNTTGIQNTATGGSALYHNSTASDNTADGFQALFYNTTGPENTATGAFALFRNTTGGDNTATGDSVLAFNTTGSENTATGWTALYNNTGGHENTASGTQALFHNISGNDNMADGFDALISNATGTQNTATGAFALDSNTTASNNTAVGYQALLNSTGSNNIAVGSSAGSSVTTGSNNIHIGAFGQAADTNTIRIGKGGLQTRAFMQGIRRRMTENANAIPVVIDSAGQLGTQSSSRRFKHDIEPMDANSESLLALKPVTFHYKSDKTKRPEFGLIAEEVADVNPDLVVRDENGEIYTVRYDAVNAMLLNEFLKEHRTVQELKSNAAKQEATIAQQQKQIEALTAGLQKVSAQLEASKPASQVVNNP